jgi:hypothetical protein
VFWRRPGKPGDVPPGVSSTRLQVLFYSSENGTAAIVADQLEVSHWQELGCDGAAGEALADCLTRAGQQTVQRGRSHRPSSRRIVHSKLFRRGRFAPALAGARCASAPPGQAATSGTPTGCLLTAQRGVRHQARPGAWIRPNPFAPISLCVRWIVAVDAECLLSAFDPTRQTGALVQTRERESRRCRRRMSRVAQSRVVGCRRPAIALAVLPPSGAPSQWRRSDGRDVGRTKPLCLDE